MNDHHLTLRQDIVCVVENARARVTLESAGRRLSFDGLTPGALQAFALLSAAGGGMRQLITIVRSKEDHRTLLRWYYDIERIFSRGWISCSVLVEGIPLLTGLAIAPDCKLPSGGRNVEGAFVLSRFAYCHRLDTEYVLESPLSKAKIIVGGWRGSALIAEMVAPRRCRDLVGVIDGVSEETVRQAINLLLDLGMVWPVRADGSTDETSSSALSSWEFHDLLFHSRSRRGRHANEVGATYRFTGILEPPLPTRRRVTTETIQLYRPDIDDLRAKDQSFTSILEQRQSIRTYGQGPITACQLGEFLYRTARVRKRERSVTGEVSSRPYPAGGAIHELELYAVVGSSDTIASGIYYYDPYEHHLCRIVGRTLAMEELLDGARRATAQALPPQVLLIIAAHFQRLAWKYESIAYALMLKHVGILCQTMYLVATAMDLAPCAIGMGDSDLFARAVGNDYYVETSIGEFALGSKP